MNYWGSGTNSSMLIESCLQNSHGMKHERNHQDDLSGEDEPYSKSRS